MIRLILLLFITGQALCQVSFKGHKLLAVIPRNQCQLKYLTDFSTNTNIDVWNLPSGINQKMTLRVEPEKAETIENSLKSKGIQYEILTDDIQEWIDNERKTDPLSRYSSGKTEDLPLNTYHSLQTINDHLDILGSKHPDLVKVKKIGTTYENNPIKGLKIGYPGKNKLTIWLDCGIHAREWLSVSTCVYIIEQLMKGYKWNKEIKEMVQAFDWHIFPVLNPDGYNYTLVNRLWRKNRARSSRYSQCIGVDLNRNFDANFRRAGASDQPCRETYRGPSAFSEPETKAIRDAIQSIGKKLKLYISIHSFSQLYMAPYASKRGFPPDYKDHMKVLKAATTALKKVHGKRYKYGPISKLLGVASGSTVDWVYDTAKVKYSFGVEVRDKGKYGFVLPKEEIIPTAEENFAAIKAIVKMVKAEYYDVNELVC